MTRASYSQDSDVLEKDTKHQTSGRGSIDMMKMALWREVLSNEKELHVWTGFVINSFCIIQKSFTHEWEQMGRTEIDRRHEYATRRKGKRGHVPQADV